MNGARRIRPAHLIYGLLIWLALLTGLAFVLSDNAYTFLFREGGIVEQSSLILWLSLAALMLLALRPRSSLGLPAALLSVLCAAREADLHRRVTGYSVLKPGYFLGDQFSTWGKLLTAAILAAALASLIALLIAWKRHGRTAGPAGHRPRRIVLLALATLAISKLFDRAPALLEEHLTTALPALITRMLMAWEEGMECMVPVVLAVAVIAVLAGAPPQSPTEPGNATDAQHRPSPDIDRPTDLQVQQ